MDNTEDSNLDDSFRNFFLGENESLNNDSSQISGSNISNAFSCPDEDQQLFNKFLTKIQDRIAYYEEENAKFETIFYQCGLLDDEKCSVLDEKVEKVLDELCDIQERFGTMELDVNALSMSYLDHLVVDDYLSDLKKSIKLYSEMNEILKEEIVMISRKLDASRKDVDEFFTLTTDGKNALENKISFYRNELANFEKKYPWLKDQKMDLQYISREANTLSMLQHDKEALERELNVYQGLKPDIKEALCQLSEKKKEYERLKSKCHV